MEPKNQIIVDTLPDISAHCQKYLGTNFTVSLESQSAFDYKDAKTNLVFLEVTPFDAIVIRPTGTNSIELFKENIECFRHAVKYAEKRNLELLIALWGNHTISFAILPHEFVGHVKRVWHLYQEIFINLKYN